MRDILYLHTQEVAGSNPASRTRSRPVVKTLRGFQLHCPKNSSLMPQPSIAVASAGWGIRLHWQAENRD